VFVDSLLHQQIGSYISSRRSREFSDGLVGHDHKYKKERRKGKKIASDKRSLKLKVEGKLI
jgi:hypothetical protein